MRELLEPIVIFTHVVRAQGFSAAARKLGISKSKVSSHISFLEQQLGVQLVQRTTRSLSLTESGELLYEHGEGILKDLDQAVAGVQALQQEIRGVLRVGITQAFGSMHLMPLIPAFMEQNPELELELSFLDHKVDVVAEGLDLLLTMSEQLPLGMVARPLMNCRFILVASPDYLSRRGVPYHPASLAEHNCLVYKSEWYEHGVWEFAKGEETCEIRVKGNYRVDDAPALKDAAKRGLGVVYLATYLLEEELAKGELIQLMPDWQLTHPLALQAVYPRRKNLAPKVRAFIDFVRSHFRDPTPWDRALIAHEHNRE
ncbi:LysR family transcriptional regulator [Ferrimonas balearica]|uniref:LysR family transcriptional regulator n=1 Tax=Ferrimonas balearica TaxID=44012 RepID=UPI001C99ED25|nr:LysR family transcriptional regulator [Ferrimonas balearica]MBY5921798.1 LysR family transcriptional regulator [Ferrimonas balearica]MBY5994862.1 LysR family transcriptional regulator [Ferrimonas balearica]